jgi:hypothetical protein
MHAPRRRRIGLKFKSKKLLEMRSAHENLDELFGRFLDEPNGYVNMEFHVHIVCYVGEGSDLMEEKPKLYGLI